MSNTPKASTFVRETKNRAGDQNDRDLAKAVSDLSKNPLTTARVVSVTLVSGDNRIVHGLTRAQGRIVVSQSAAANLTDPPNADPRVWILNASAPCTVKLIFF